MRTLNVNRRNDNRFSTVPFDYQAQQGGKSFAALSQVPQILLPFLTQEAGATAALLHAHKTRIGQFSPGRILSNSFSGFLSRPFHIEQIIGDLENHAETASIMIQINKNVRIRSSQVF